MTFIRVCVILFMRLISLIIFSLLLIGAPPYLCHCPPNLTYGGPFASIQFVLCAHQTRSGSDTLLRDASRWLIPVYLLVRTPDPLAYRTPAAARFR